ncbi:hypothetical protein VTO42DRAFT_4039 [Malbranchea cinnamomea]
MFRRKRSSSHAPINQNPSPSAQTAAVQAFRASQIANANTKLSSAAAAAALQKHPPTPTCVADVQTKRTLRRQRSVSSVSNVAGVLQHGGQEGGLRRSHSSGSMMTRTFRERSPGRVSPVVNPHRVIPVPPIPPVYATSGSSHGRSASLQPTSRPNSHSDNSISIQPSSVDGSSVQLQTVTAAVTRKANSPELQRSGSINFSYPMNARPNSPRQAPFAGVHQSSSLHISSQSSRPRVQPVSRDSLMEQGQKTHGQRMNEDTRATVLQRTTGRGPSKRTLPNHRFRGLQAPNSGESSERSPTSGYVYDSQAAPAPVDKLDIRVPRKRPSTIRERELGDEGGKDPQTPHAVPGNISKLQGISDCPSVTWLQPLQETNPHLEEVDQNTQTTSSLLLQKQAPKSSCAQESRQNNNVPPRILTRSSSQTRATRFSEHLQIACQGEPLHTPPPRSVSPVKPALKRSTSQSQSPDRTIVHDKRVADAAGEASDCTSAGSEEVLQGKAKKKTTKVSFEDENEGLNKAVNPTSSPSSSAPLSSRFYLNSRKLGSESNHERQITNNDDFDEVLKPRPALPSFGSIRGRRKLSEEPEQDRAQQETSQTTRMPLHLLFSSDHAIGGILNDDSTKDISPDTQVTPGLPLAPEVTSVEGNGYDFSSDESSDSDDVADPGEFSPPGDELHTSSVSAASDSMTNGLQKLMNGPVQQSRLAAVPIISIQPATPRFEQSRPAAGSETTQLVAPSSRVEATKGGDSDSESGESIYSDAAESLSDLDGDCFGSIDAIVGSPMSKVPIFTHASSHSSTSPIGLRFDIQKSDNAGKGNFSPRPDSSSPGSRSNQSTEASHVVERNTSSPSQVTSPQQSSAPMTPPRQNSVTWSTEKASNHPQSVAHEDQPLPQSSPSYNSPAVQSMLRPTQGGQNKPEGRQRNVVPQYPEKNRKYTPSSPSDSISTNGRAKAAIRTDMRTTEFCPGDPLQWTFSNDSDSSSSFKRARRSPPFTGRHNLRRTLRSSGGHERSFSAAAAPFTESSTAPRHLKPPFSPEGRSSVLRTTLRGSPSGGITKSPFSDTFGKPTRYGSLPGRNIFNISSQRSEIKGREPSRGRFGTFSDDEDDFRPVRGIPRPAGAVDGDSTELEDSSDSDSRQNVLRRRRMSNGRPVTPKTTDVLSSGEKIGVISDHNLDFVSPENRKQRAGLLNRLILSRRNRRSDVSRAGKLDVASTARRDTPLERSRLEIERARLATPPPAPPATSSINDSLLTTPPNRWRSMSPKLQERLSTRTGSGTWLSRSNVQNGDAFTETTPNFSKANEQATVAAVISVATNGDEAPRPHTSDGIVENEKPAVSNSEVKRKSSRSRRLVQEYPQSPLSDGGDSSMGKKRRFSLLRKALRLRQ